MYTYILYMVYYVQCLRKSTTFITSIFSEYPVMQFFFKFIQTEHLQSVRYIHTFVISYDSWLKSAALRTQELV